MRTATLAVLLSIIPSTAMAARSVMEGIQTTAQVTPLRPRRTRRTKTEA